MRKITLICPCYNEEDVIEHFINSVSKILSQLSLEYEILFINDGSTDTTLDKLILFQTKYNHIRILSLSRNFGKEAALTAGIDFADADAVIPIDADLQDPPELIPEMIKKWQEGYDVVLAKRISRKHDSAPKRISANWFYKLHNKISDQNLPVNVGDFRLMDKCVVHAVRAMPERQRFMKGILSWAGFKTTTIKFDRIHREIGSSKFNAWKLWNLALEGVTSFSTAPLKIWWYVGGMISFLSLLYGLIIIFRTIILGVDVPGYTSLLTVILFFGGIQLLGLGILGEYIGRIYIETKQRPIYIIDKEYK